MLFQDRKDAGLKLAQLLRTYEHASNTLVVGLARGGVAVAFEIAQALSLPLHVIVPRKIGAPDNKEFAIGSIMENGVSFFNESLIDLLRVPREYIEQEVTKEQEVAKQRLRLYHQENTLEIVKHKHILLVDDGIATGYTMLSAIKALKDCAVQKIIVVSPVASTEAIQSLSPLADHIVCPYVLDDFMSVGMHYATFNQVEDEEVIKLINQSKHINTTP